MLAPCVGHKTNPTPHWSLVKKAKSGKKNHKKPGKDLKQLRKHAVCRVVHHRAQQVFPVGNPSWLWGCYQMFLQGEAWPWVASPSSSSQSQ